MPTCEGGRRAEEEERRSSEEDDVLTCVGIVIYVRVGEGTKTKSELCPTRISFLEALRFRFPTFFFSLGELLFHFLLWVGNTVAGYTVAGNTLRVIRCGQ